MKPKKTELLQARVSKEERQEINQYLEESGMNLSTLIRTCIRQQPLQVVDNGQAIMTEICTIHASLGGEELVSRDLVEEGLQKLCQLLKR